MFAARLALLLVEKVTFDLRYDIVRVAIAIAIAIAGMRIAHAWGNIRTPVAMSVIIIDVVVMDAPRSCSSSFPCCCWR